LLVRDAERAEAAAKEEEDRHMQKVDPKNSLAWKRGGESRVSHSFVAGDARRVFVLLAETCLQAHICSCVHGVRVA
jgi:hypothetical protein